MERNYRMTANLPPPITSLRSPSQRCYGSSGDLLFSAAAPSDHTIGPSRFSTKAWQKCCPFRRRQLFLCHASVCRSDLQPRSSVCNTFWVIKIHKQPHNVFLKSPFFGHWQLRQRVRGGMQTLTNRHTQYHPRCGEERCKVSGKFLLPWRLQAVS